MPKTVVGMFDTFGEAQSAVQDLVRFGVRREDISLVARDEHGTVGEAHEVGGPGAAEGAGAGAVGGTVVGGALGLLIGAGLLVIPGIGPVLAAGPLAAAVGSTAAAVGATALGAGIGAAAGGLLGSLMGAGVAENEAQAYVEGVRRGGTLVTVGAAANEADEVRAILLRNGAVDMDVRAAEWRSVGWDATGADAYAAGNVALGNPVVDSDSDAFAAGNVARARDGYDASHDADMGIPRGDSYAIGGRPYSADAARAAAAERGEPGDYDFRDDENLAGADRKVVDTSYTDVDRTGERVKGPAGYASGHGQPFDADPAQFHEFAAQGQQNMRRDDDAPDSRQASDADTASESTRRAPHFAGEDAMGGAVSGMQGGSGSAQPGAFSSTPGRPLSSDQRAALAGDSRKPGGATSDELRGRGGPRIYDRPGRQPELDTARAGHEEAVPAQGDFARGMREETPPAAEPDYARGLHDEQEPARQSDGDPSLPRHGDFARGQREAAAPLQPDYARGLRSDERYDADFLKHYQALTGAGGQPYDYYKPGYQFGLDLGNDPSFGHDSWGSAEHDARQRWEREARGSWDEFKQAIRYGWEKARGRA